MTMTGAKMAGMSAIIADDEIHLAEDLRRRLTRLWPELQIVAVVHDGEAAASALQEYHPDIAFLDIRMPGQSGLDAARSARAGTRVVFVTAYDNHAIQAFEHAAVDYLLKPVSEDRLMRCVQRLQQGSVTVATVAATSSAASTPLAALSARPEPLRWLRAQVGQSVRMLAVDEVCYFQSADKYTAVMTADAELLLRTPLKELIAQLDARHFWQVHRGSVVNARKIISAHFDLMGKVSLTLRDRTEKVAVSQSYSHLFRQM